MIFSFTPILWSVCCKFPWRRSDMLKNNGGHDRLLSRRIHAIDDECVDSKHRPKPYWVLSLFVGNVSEQNQIIFFLTTLQSLTSLDAHVIYNWLKLKDKHACIRAWSLRVPRDRCIWCYLHIPVQRALPVEMGPNSKGTPNLFDVFFYQKSTILCFSLKASNWLLSFTCCMSLIQSFFFVTSVPRSSLAVNFV